MPAPCAITFFEMAPENTVAFFEVKKTKPFQVPAGLPDLRKAQFDHLSFKRGRRERAE